jgi:hypothetical protein
MQVIIHYREAADAHRENLGQLFDSIFDPLPAIEQPLAKQQRTPHTAGNAVIPGGHRHIDQFFASDRHGRISCEDPYTVRKSSACVKIIVPGISCEVLANSGPAIDGLPSSDRKPRSMCHIRVASHTTWSQSASFAMRVLSRLVGMCPVIEVGIHGAERLDIVRPDIRIDQLEVALRSPSLAIAQADVPWPAELAEIVDRLEGSSIEVTGRQGGRALPGPDLHVSAAIEIAEIIQQAPDQGEE